MLDRLIAEKSEQNKKPQAIQDDKPTPKAKAPKPAQKVIRKVTKSKRPQPKNKPPVETEPQKTGEKRDQEIQINETPITAPKKRLKTHLKKKMMQKHNACYQKGSQETSFKEWSSRFLIGGDESPKTQNIKRLAESGSKVPTVKRRRGKIGI